MSKFELENKVFNSVPQAVYSEYWECGTGDFIMLFNMQDEIIAEYKVKEGDL